MAITYVEKDASYTIKDRNAAITVAVVTGEGQGSGYLIFLGMQLCAANTPALLGKGADCAEQTLLVSATIRDRLPQTNLTSVTLYISEGERPAEKFGPYEQEARQHLDTVAYTISIELR